MSVLSRVATPAATHDLAGMVVALFSNPERAAPRDLPGSVRDQLPGDDNQLAASVVGRLVTGPTGLGTSAARIPSWCTAVSKTVAAPGRGVELRMPDGPTGLGTSARGVSAGPSASNGSGLELSCPPALRDDEALGEEEWATDDHFLDDESIGADAKVIGSRLGITYAAVDLVDLPVSYVPQLDQALSEEPVAVAYRSAFEHLARYASATQVARLRHELSVMFMAYNHEADWPGEKSSPQKAIERGVEIHNELMHTFVEEASVLSHLGSLALRRFLADIWAWLGGNREWHSTTERYHGASNA